MLMNLENGSSVENFESENIQAEGHITSGNLPDAARILVSIVDKDPQNWRAFNNLGIISWSQNAWFDAFAMFKKASLLKADYTDALVNLLDAAIKLRKVKEILPILEKSLQINPAQDEIRVIYDSIIEQGDKIYSSRRAIAIGFYSPIIEEAEKELEGGNLFKAMELFLKSNDQDGPNAAAFCGLGIISFYQKRYQDAYTLFFESIKMNPSDPDTYLNLLDAAKECKLIAEAKELFNLYKNQFPELETVAQEFEKA
jgi:tetratricopeptide (TPR) repeat protein